MRKSADNIYNVVVSDNGYETTLTYSAPSKWAVSNFAKRDLKGKQKIVSIERLKPEHGKLLLSRQEVADIFGVSCQTISNYVSRGILKVAKVSEKNSIMFDRDMVETIRPVSDEIQACLEKAEAYKEELDRTNETAQEEIEKVRASVGIDVSVKSNLGSNMLMSMVKVALGDRYNRMFSILNDYLLGKEIKAIAQHHGLTHERTLQIINKAVETLKTLRPYDEIMTENDTLRAENNALKRQVAALQAELQTCQSFDAEMTFGLTLEEHHLYELLKTRIEDLNISVRTLKPLICEDIKTLGDLLQYNKTDLLKLRNFGKKALTELDDLVEEMNLSFGMKDEIQKLMKKNMMSNQN